MMRRAALGAAMVAATLAEARPFEVVALVDSIDFARVYDVETATGSVQVLDHVLRTHCTDVWWRDKGGGLMRYPSAAESWALSETPFKKARIPTEDFWGHLRMAAPRANAFPLIRSECLRRGLRFGIHTTTEENHNSSSSTANWTLDHPEFWSCTKSGTPFMGTASYAYPEVVEHKLTLVDERIALRPSTVFLDTFRHGNWCAAREYVRPMIDEWRGRYACEPPDDPNDPRWIALVERHVEDYVRRFSAKCRSAGVRFVVGLHAVDGECDRRARVAAGFDWRKLAAEGSFDAIVPMIVIPGKDDPFADAARIYQYVSANRGRADVYFPVSAYDFCGNGISTYVKRTNLPVYEVVRRLMRLAFENGGRGVVLECVDYGNYSDEACRAIADTLKELEVAKGM